MPWRQLLWRLLILSGCLWASLPARAGVLDVGGETLHHEFYHDATNHLNPVLPDNFDLEGTWRLDASQAHVGMPHFPNGYERSASLIAGMETEHYGVDTMTLKRTGFEIIDPILNSYYPTNLFYYPDSFYWPYSTSVSPTPGSERVLIYHYTGTLTHRMAVGCEDSLFDDGSADGHEVYYPQSTLFIQDMTFQLDAALELHFDLGGNFVWSDFVFNGSATTPPAYPEFPTNIVAQRDGLFFDTDSLSPDDWLSALGLAPYLGVFQNLSGDMITFNGAGVWPAGIQNGNRTDPGGRGYISPYVVTYDSVNAIGTGFDVPMPEFGNVCSPAGSTTIHQPPVIKTFDFKSMNYTAGQFAGIPFLGGGVVEVSRVFWRRVSDEASSLPTGLIRGQLQDAQTHLTITRGQARLYQQRGTLAAPTAGESPSDYNAYVLSNATFFASTSVDANGFFSFTNVPVFGSGGDTAAGLKSVVYAVMGVNAEADATFITTNTVIFYQDGTTANVAPQPVSPTLTPVPLQTLADIGTKQALAKLLQGLSTNNYATYEGWVLQDLDILLANSGAVTDQQKEGVKRAIWAERAAKEGALQAKDMIPDMMKAVANVINDVLGALMPNTSGRGAQGKKFLDEVKSGKTDPLDMSQFKVPAGVTGDLEDILIKDGTTFENFGLIDAVLDGLSSTIKTGLLAAGMQDSTAASISSGFFKTLKLMATAMRTIVGNGAKSKAPPSAIVSYVVPLFAPLVFDNSLVPSYCSLTTKPLQDSEVLMRTWSTNNQQAYLNDIYGAANVISNMVDQGTFTKQSMAYLTAFTDTAGSSSKVLGLIGNVSGQAYFKAVAEVAGKLEKLGNAASFAVPARHIFWTLPNGVSNGVYAAYGYPPPLPGPAALPKQSAMNPSLLTSAPMEKRGLPKSVLTNGLALAYAPINQSISTILAGMGTNNLGLVVTQMTRATPTFGDTVTAWRKATSRVRKAAATSGNGKLPDDLLTSLATSEAKFGLLADGFDYDLIEMLHKVVTGVYKGVTDTNYLADRAAAQSDAQTLLNQIDQQNSILASLLNGSDLSTGLPILELSLSLPLSQATGARWATLANEMFTLTSHVANVSGAAVSGVALKLSIEGPDGLAANVLASILPASPLTLAANDGIDGSGADEASVVWQIRYTGPLDSATAYFVVSAVENGSDPVSFTADSQTRVLQADPDIQDSDGDGIPDDWTMKYFGHPKGQASDKSRAQDDADGDGLTNLQEYQLGTNPLLADTDGDGLTDYEEVTGSKTGVITDPLNPDTDGDGLADGVDPFPLDPTGAPGVARPTVVLTLSTNTITLGPGNVFASIQVTNPGAGPVNWTASADPSAPFQLNPVSPALGTNGDVLTIALSPLYDYASSPTLQTLVQVTPSGLNQGPAQTLTVNIQGGLRQPPAITQQPQGGGAQVGSSLTLNVGVSGAPPLRYQWQYKDVNLARATNASLTLYNLSGTNSGNYRVIVSSTAGSTTSAEAALVVYSPVLLAAQPQSVTVPLGGSATLKAAASGTAPLYYQWLYNGNPLAGKTTATLTLPSVAASNAGLYSVTVSNAYSSVASTQAVVALIAPAPVITAPVPGTFTTNNNRLTVRGTEKNGAGVTNIAWQLSGGPINSAAGLTNWTALVPLNPGTNFFIVWAQNAFGSSARVTNRYIFIPAAPLTLVTNPLAYGNKITPSVGGQLLVVGKPYTLTAAPGLNQLFSNWFGGVTPAFGFLGANPAYPFLMQSNLVLQANFVTNVFLAAQGKYAGLFAPTNDVRQHTNSGAIALQVLPTGSFSGSLLIGAEKISLAGKFDVSGSATVRTPRTGKNTMTTRLQLDFANRLVQGDVTDGAFTAPLTGYQNVFGGNNKAAYLAGQYTLALSSAGSSAVGPYGNSYGSVKVDLLGNLTLGGSLADGTGLSQGTFLAQNGLWAFYAPLYSGSVCIGSIWGWNFISGSLYNVGPQPLSWIEITNPSPKALYRAGFTNQNVYLYGSPYSPTNQPLLGFTNGVVLLQAGNLPFSISNHVIISANNTMTVTNAAERTNKLALTINKANGTVSGSFANPAKPAQMIPVNGVLLQNRSNVWGYFPGVDQSGLFMIVPP